MPKRLGVRIRTGLYIVLLLFLVFVGFFVWYETNTTEIVFRCCINSIVEVKATTEAIGESFGSAVLLSENGHFVTNAHVVSYEKFGEYVLFENVQI